MVLVEVLVLFVLKNSEDATKAIAEMHGKIISNKPLFVTLAQRKEQRVLELQTTYQQRQQRQIMVGNNPMFQQRYQNFGTVKPRYMGSQNKPLQQKTPLTSKPINQQQKQQQQQKTTTTLGNNTTKPIIQQKQTKDINQQQQQQGSEVKYNLNVRNKQQTQPKQKQSQLNTTTETSKTGLDATYLASLTSTAQKQTLGENLFPLVQNEVPQLAGKITGMLLEMENSDILNLLESPEALKSKIAEAVNVVKAHEKQ